MSASVRCRGCGQHHATPRVIQALPRPSVDEDRRPSGAVATIVVAAFVTVIAILNGLVPAVADLLVAVLP